MFQLRTRADLIFMLCLSTLVTAMGVLFLIYPPRPVPTDPAAYDAVSGVLSAVVDRSSRKHTQVEFQLMDDPKVFETRAVPWRGGAERWMTGNTVLRFHIERGGPFKGVPNDAVPTFGLVADGQASRTLIEDIAYTNAGTGPWGGILALCVGCPGLAIVAFKWHKLERFTT